MKIIDGHTSRPLAVNPYSPYQLKNALYMAVGPDDNLWVSERGVAPTRFAAFNSENGTWVRDFYGPIGYPRFDIFDILNNDLNPGTKLS